MKERYIHLNQYLKNKFGERVLKICIDGGFTCPNRDGKKGNGGCIFCSENGSGEHIRQKDISKQIETHLNSYRGQRANKFIAYFQNFTNTYAPLSILKERYESVLKYEQIVALGIATRPDCITEEIVVLLQQLNKRIYVYVELGLQTSNDKTGDFLNRKYSSQDFIKAVKILRKYNIDVVAHIMIGLPGENLTDLKNTVDFINQQDISGLKIHSTYVVKNTVLALLYNSNKYVPMKLEEYIDCAVYVLRHLRPNIVIHRISGDAPKDILLAPEWNLHKKWIINGINKKMEELNAFQGDEYKKG